MLTARQKVLGVVGACVVSVLLALTTTEIALRLTGFEFQMFPVVQFGWPEPRVIQQYYQSDPDLLWVTRGYQQLLESARRHQPAVVFMPVGLRLNGRHALGWISGLALGYTTSCLVFWAVIAGGTASGPMFIAAWLLEAVALWLVARFWPWPSEVEPWTRHDTAIFVVVLALAPLLMAAPYRNVGAMDRSGTRYYRAYFTADFVWHMALTSELQRFEIPPRNPYMASEPLHYYWTYFLVPATITAKGPAPVQDVERALKVNALCSGIMSTIRGMSRGSFCRSPSAVTISAPRADLKPAAKAAV